jgi:hypothetical protein
MGTKGRPANKIPAELAVIGRYIDGWHRDLNGNTQSFAGSDPRLHILFGKRNGRDLVRHMYSRVVDCADLEAALKRTEHVVLGHPMYALSADSSQATDTLNHVLLNIIRSIRAKAYTQTPLGRWVLAFESADIQVRCNMHGIERETDLARGTLLGCTGSFRELCDFMSIVSLVIADLTGQDIRFVVHGDDILIVGSYDAVSQANGIMEECCLLPNRVKAYCSRLGAVFAEDMVFFLARQDEHLCTFRQHDLRATRSRHYYTATFGGRTYSVDTFFQRRWGTLWSASANAGFGGGWVPIEADGPYDPAVQRSQALTKYTYSIASHDLTEMHQYVPAVLRLSVLTMSFGGDVGSRSLLGRLAEAGNALFEVRRQSRWAAVRLTRMVWHRFGELRKLVTYPLTLPVAACGLGMPSTYAWEDVVKQWSTGVFQAVSHCHEEGTPSASHALRVERPDEGIHWTTAWERASWVLGLGERGLALTEKFGRLRTVDAAGVLALCGYPCVSSQVVTKDKLIGDRLRDNILTVKREQRWPSVSAWRKGWGRCAHKTMCEIQVHRWINRGRFIVDTGNLQGYLQRFKRLNTRRWFPMDEVPLLERAPRRDTQYAPYVPPKIVSMWKDPGALWKEKRVRYCPVDSMTPTFPSGRTWKLRERLVRKELPYMTRSLPAPPKYSRFETLVRDPLRRLGDVDQVHAWHTRNAYAYLRRERIPLRMREDLFHLDVEQGTADGDLEVIEDIHRMGTKITGEMVYHETLDNG